MPTTTVTCKVSAITKVQSGSPTRSYSGAAQDQFTLRSGAHYTLVQFGLPRDLPKSTVLAAKLQFRGVAVYPGSRSVSAQAIRAQIRSTTTWANFTGQTNQGLLDGSEIHAGGLLPGSTVWYEIDVDEDFQKVAAGGAYYGHRLSTNDATARAFFSRTHPTAYPRLVLTYATETPPPVGVKPSGVVAVQSPTFSWLAPVDVTAVQAQAAPVDTATDPATGGFVTPAWTSQERLSKVGQINTAQEGWQGVADGGEAAVQFRQRGSLGWSKWSLPVEVQRDAYADLQIVYPAVNGVTNDPTPPHLWVFPGQSKFQLTVFNAAGKTLYDSGQVPGSDQEWTPNLTSAGIKATTTLNTRLRVWDDRNDRVASPGDPGYVEKRWAWALSPSADTPPVDALSVQVRAGRPVPVLRWARAGAEPDEWIIERDGDLVYRFDVDENRLSDTTWQYEDWNCPPNRKVLYTVRAVQGGKMSHATIVRTVHHQLEGVVIAEPSSGAWFNVADPAAAANLSKTETTMLYQGPYAQGPVKRVVSLGGLSGQISGFLETDAEDPRPISEQVAAAELIRSMPTRTCRLIYGLLNIPVDVSGIDPTIHEDAQFDHMMHKVKCSVAQTGEFDTDTTGIDTPVGS